MTAFCGHFFGIGATIRNGWENQSLLYAGFLYLSHQQISKGPAIKKYMPLVVIIEAHVALRKF